jgi:hypothetical protein
MQLISLLYNHLGKIGAHGERRLRVLWGTHTVSQRHVFRQAASAHGGLKRLAPWVGRAVTPARASSDRLVPGPGMGKEVVAPSRTLAEPGRQGISPPNRGSSPISLRPGPRQGNAPPGDDPHEGGPGRTEALSPPALSWHRSVPPRNVPQGPWDRARDGSWTAGRGSGARPRIAQPGPLPGRGPFYRALRKLRRVRSAPPSGG